jgi:hypothetical protein
MSVNNFRREGLLSLAQAIVSSRDSYTIDVANYKQEWVNSFEDGRTCNRDDFLSERGTWDVNVFIPSIQDAVKRDRVFYLWKQKGTKNRTGNAKKENKELAKELATFDPMFNDIANQMFGVPKSGFKRPRDDAEDEQQLYETGPKEIKFGINLIKTHFPNINTVVECCAGTGVMVQALKERGYNVIALDKYPKDDTIQQCDIYTDPFPEDYDILFTNPPFKYKADLFQVLYEKCIKRGKGFCVMLPFETDSQLGVARVIKEMLSQGVALQKVTMDWQVKFKRLDGRDCKPVGQLSWFIGGSTVLPDKEKIIITSSYGPEDEIK